jgi:hypothetical protein
MIPKANQRAGGRQLATHLLNAFDNDRVDVADIRGAVADNLHGAFDEWWAVSKTTRCRKYLYSLSINPDPDQRPVTRDEYYDYIGRVEKALGLSGQARAVVFHVKHGREHCHVVWSRIVVDKLRAVQLSYDRQTLRTVTQEFARDHGLGLPPGMRQDSLADRFNNRQKFENLGEKQQEERTGIRKDERRAAITAAWQESHDGKSFVSALEERGYFLARGIRGYVVVDLFGEIHYLSRQIDGVTAAAVRKRLIEHPLEKLPDADKAQAYARTVLEKQRAAAPEVSKTTAAQMRADLAKAQSARRAQLDEKRRDLAAQHKAEREALEAAQDAEEKGVLSARLRAQPKGMIAFIARITGIRLLIDHRRKKQDKQRQAEHSRQKLALQRRHEREVMDFQHRHRGLTALEKREKRSLETALRRDQFRLITRASSIAPAKTAGKQAHPPALTAEQRAHMKAMQRAGLDPDTPAKRRRSLDTAIAERFNQTATRDQDQPLPEPVLPDVEKEKGKGGGRGLAKTFNRAAGTDRDDPGRGRSRQPRFPVPGIDRWR